MSSPGTREQHLAARDQEREQRLVRLQRIMGHYGCDAEDAHRFLDLRDDGHSAYEASVLAGIADPHR